MSLATDLEATILDVPDFPKAGVTFKDITPVLADPPLYRRVVEALAATAPEGTTVVCGMESRGFIVGAPVALALGAKFVPVRKAGKLPRETVEVSYDLEYGAERLAIHADAITSADRVLLVDDVLATGGTVVATAELVRRLGGELAGVSVLMELGFLAPRTLLAQHGIGPVNALVAYA